MTLISFANPADSQNQQVLAPAVWQNIKLSDQYQVSFRLFGERTVLTTPNGLADPDSIRQLHKLQRMFREEFIGIGQPFFEARDYALIPGLPSAECRKAQSDCFVAAIGQCLGFFYYNPSVSIRTVMKMGQTLKVLPFLFEYAESLEDVLQKTSQAVAELNTQCPWKREAIRWFPEYTVKTDRGKIESGILAPNVMVTRFEGYISETAINSLMDAQEKLLALGTLVLHNHIRIFDYSLNAECPPYIRPYFTARLHDLFQITGTPSLLCISGNHTTTRSIVASLQDSFRPLLRTANHLESALLCAERSISNKFPVPAEFLIDDAETDSEEEKLAKNIGRLCWSEDANLDPVSPNHPFKKAYDAIELLRHDFKTMQEERRQAEMHLLATNRDLQTAHKTRSEFLAAVSHEMRTPLNGIIGMLQLMEHAHNEAEGQDFQQTALRAAHALLEFVERTLNLAKLESGNFDLHITAFDLSHAVTRITSEHKHNFQLRGLDFSLEIDERIPKWVKGDEERFSQIIHCLLDNAGKFTSSGMIATRLLCKEDQQDKILVSLEVLDSGIGIPAHMQSRIFEPFVQVDGSYSRQYGGAGMGLAIVQRIIAAMEGTISVTSAPGKGSTFQANIWFEKC